MSLVGNLEDLSLGDIMQIISLSQKSGVLALEGDGGAGRIVFQSGLVHAACVKGRSDGLRGLLVKSGLVEGPAFDALAAKSRVAGHPVEQTIARDGGVSSERIEELLRESVEAAILEMFSWLSGDFSFDVRSTAEPDDPGLSLSTGINAQYLVMEGMRIRDERSRDEAGTPVDPNQTAPTVDSSPLAGALFGSEPLETEAFLFDNESEGVAREAKAESEAELSAADLLVATVVSREDPHATPAGNAAVLNHQATEPSSNAASPEPAAIRSTPTRSLPVVLIDPDVSVLEWMKATIQDDFARVHVFQQAEQGLARIRQYLIRGELPVVLISTEIRIDPLSGIHGLSDFVERLKMQAARLTVVGLVEGDEKGSPSARPPAFDAVLVRPSRKQLREGRETITSETAQQLTSTLNQILSNQSAASEAQRAPSPAPKQASVQDLRDASEKLEEASSRGEILPVVLDFASELFARVAILIVREERVFAIAGRGINALEVAPLDSEPPVSLRVLDDGWLRTVLQSGKSLQAPPSTAADQELLARLGGVQPVESYLGPIESGGSIIAVLYGDQAPGGVEMPDTRGLEVVLRHAGLALDRAALERALWEANAKQD